MSAYRLVRRGQRKESTESVTELTTISLSERSELERGNNDVFDMSELSQVKILSTHFSLF